MDDPKPDDLLVSRMKFAERRMDVRTSAACIRLDDLRVGVKSLSNLAMAGSCRNMPKYSAIKLLNAVKYGLNLQTGFGTEFIPTLKVLSVLGSNGGQCVRYCSKTRTRETGVKVPKYMLSVTNLVLNLRQ